jgi:hypothetical protein
MNELPKSVRDQLARAQVPATSHPDADILTAYSENSLGAAERQRITEHLTTCSECREVLFLSQPEPASTQFVAKAARAHRSGWMVWVSVAAVGVVVVSAVVIQQEKAKKAENPVLVATEAKPANIPAHTVESLKETSPSNDAMKSNVSRESDPLAIVTPPAKPTPIIEEPEVKLPPSQEVAALDKKSKDAAGKAGGLVADQATQNYQNAIAARQAPSGPSQSMNANVTNVYTAQNTAPAAAPMQKARKTEAARDISTAFGDVQSGDLTKLKSARAHWRISKSGGLERSYADNDWTPVPVGAGSVFRVISIVGNVVWAGGTNGSLYVSRDGGADWAPIKIDTTADVVSIHFDDEVNGKILTSDGKTWKTSDAGNSWAPL